RSDGSFVVAWQSASIDGSGDAIMARRYNANGGALAAQFRVNRLTAGDQQFASVTIDSSGNFLITWQSAGQDGSGNAVLARTYNSSGTALGNELVVNQFTTGNQDAPAAAALSGGGFVVAWRSADQDGSGDGI